MPRPRGREEEDDLRDRVGVYGFEAEEVGTDLSRLPLAARRALDRAGLHLSLEGWGTLAPEAREAITSAGAGAEVDVEEVRRHAKTSAVAPREEPPRPELDAEAPPEALRVPLGASVAAAWPALDPLARFALAHLARRSVERNDDARLRAAIEAIVPAPARPGARIRDAALSVDEAIAAVSHAGAGGVDLFVGVVRETNEGRAVSLLEYSAYRSMAEAELSRIEQEITESIPGVRVYCTHRVGALGVGDLAVICAASAPHRGEAFAACRRLIDEIKSRLPIWKREHGPDGPYWVGWEDARCGPGHEGHGHDHGRGH